MMHLKLKPWILAGIVRHKPDFVSTLWCAPSMISKRNVKLYSMQFCVCPCVSWYSMYTLRVRNLIPLHTSVFLKNTGSYRLISGPWHDSFHTVNVSATNRNDPITEQNNALEETINSAVWNYIIGLYQRHLCCGKGKNCCMLNYLTSNFWLTFERSLAT